MFRPDYNYSLVTLHKFADLAGVKADFVEVPKVTYLEISVFFRKVYTGVEIKGKIFDWASIY